VGSEDRNGVQAIPSPIRRRLSVRLLLVFSLSIALVAVGCSDERGSDTTASSESQEETQAQSQEEDVFTPMTASFVGGDTAAVKGTDGRYHVVYELLLTNTRPVPATLQAVEVLDAADGTTILRSEGEDLVDLMRTLDAQPAEDTSLPPNESRMVYLTVSFESEEDVPEALANRIEAMAAAGPGATEPTSVEYGVGILELAGHTPPVFSPPLEGEGWLAVNGCCGPDGVHRSAVLAVDGNLYDAQRFAIDWMRLNEDGQLVVGDPSETESYVSYGATVMAAADGVVVDVLDALEDNVPGQLPDPNSITIETVDGNHVILDHGNGLYSFYAHLQPGSVEVEVGDEVQAGDQLGLLGNTGNTSAPHLHFHIMAGPSAIGSDGLPYVLDSFLLAGVADGREAQFDAALSEGEASFPSRSELDPVEHERELPLDNAIVNFPSG